MNDRGFWLTILACASLCALMAAERMASGIRADLQALTRAVRESRTTITTDVPMRVVPDGQLPPLGGMGYRK